MKRIDLNVDIGEGFTHDEALLKFASSANICCGEHAGSWDLTLSTIQLCHQRNVRIGAHPGFPDRDTMGRRYPKEYQTDAFTSVRAQIELFLETGFASYVKPHGALYNLITGLCDDVGLIGLGVALTDDLANRWHVPTMLLPVGVMASQLQGRGLLIAEGFADRAYDERGRLVPRTEPNAVLTDPQQIATQTLRLAPSVDSICLHGDTPHCLEFAELVYKTLTDAGYEVSSGSR